MSEESAAITNGNGHVLSARPTSEQNGAATDEISYSNGCHACHTNMWNFKELLTKPHIQQRLNAYKGSKQSRIDKFLAHLESKQMQYLENICSHVLGELIWGKLHTGLGSANLTRAALNNKVCKIG